MNEPYDEDDGYNDDHYDYDDQNMWYFKFDISQNPSFSKWINDIVNNIIDPLEDSINDKVYQAWGFDKNKTYVFPVNSWNPNTVNNKFQYLGSNYNQEPIWKTKYWVNNSLNQEYKSHLQAHANHFIQQPNYYNGLFDNLN